VKIKHEEAWPEMRKQGISPQEQDSAGFSFANILRLRARRNQSQFKSKSPRESQLTPEMSGNARKIGYLEEVNRQQEQLLQTALSQNEANKSEANTSEASKSGNFGKAIRNQIQGLCGKENFYFHLN